MDDKFYMNEQEIWGEKRCIDESKHTATDGMGTPYPFKGYIGSHFGQIRYNGGCLRGSGKDECHYEGDIFPLPKIHKSFEIIVVSSWGYRIRKKGSE